MYAAVEHGPVLCSDSNILCLSWKGRVPKSEKEKPVCRRRYYEEGWLATGNGRGVVGVTFTSSHCRRDRNTPQRINFNLRGHNSEVSWGFVALLSVTCGLFEPPPCGFRTCFASFSQLAAKWDFWNCGFWCLCPRGNVLRWTQCLVACVPLRAFPFSWMPLTRLSQQWSPTSRDTRAALCPGWKVRWDDSDLCVMLSALSVTLYA